MLLVGLTGGIGSGKSSVSERMARVGAVVIDADAIVHELQSPGQVVLAEMVELMGEGILHPDGTLDRQAVADVVFHDKEKLAALGEIVHPRVRDELFRRVAEQAETDHVVILDIPLLAESGWEGIVGTIVVDVDPELAVQRLVEHRGFSEEDARARIANQASRDERLAKATWVIDNSGDLADLEVATMVVWEELMARRDEAARAAGDGAGAGAGAEVTAESR
jgi:dephospho-CoA kinase